MTEKETGMIVSRIAAMWPRFEVLPNVTIKAWYSSLYDQDFKLIDAAVTWHSRNADHGFPPSVPEIFKAVRKIQGATELSAIDAWESCKSFDVNKLTPRTRKALDFAGGMQRFRFCDVTTELPHMRRAFIEAYDQLTNEEQATGLPEPLKAILEKRDLKALPGGAR